MFLSSFRTTRILLLPGLLLTLSGCMISPLASRTAAFSAAATATVAQTTNAYQLVNQAYYDAQLATLVANYDTTTFDPSQIKPYLPEKDLAVRTQVLNGLTQYATLLAEVSGNQPVTDLETQVKAAGNSLVKLQQDDFKAFKISTTEQNLAVTAITALGDILIERDRARSLPGILDKMDKPIHDICAILQSDIGTVDKPGLAHALHLEYDNQIADEQRFIQKNGASMTPEQKRTEIETLPKLVLAQQQADRTLAATAKSLASLADAHTALTATKTQKDAPAFKVKLAELLQDAQTINGFYQTSLK